ncbi:MAG TPA: DUF1329 domain-containing protein [Candidatus Binatia bacterium]|nr:DUF1329 domain-containing protein [Candidatus Binatia bacterium]
MEQRRQYNTPRGHIGRRFSSAGRTFILILSIVLVSGIRCSSLWAEESAILDQFYPYRHGAPHIPGLEADVTLSSTNAQLAKEVLPDEILRLLTSGDFTITIQETMDLHLRQSYIDATLQHWQSVSLNGGGTLANYQSGAPFPLLDPTDPQAGEKLAWNFRYRDFGETFEMWPTTREVNAAGQVEHFDRGIQRIRFGMHRPNPADNDPRWQEEGIWQKNFFELLSPSDREGVMRILTVYEDDTRSAEQWRYTPQNRRTRKDYVNYLAPIGGTYEVLQEEGPPFFFSGYLHAYRWRFLGTQVMLVPGFTKTTELQFGGNHGWYPQIPWELRRVLLLECTPKEAHPFGRRVFFLDQQSYTPLLILTYTPAGDFLRLILNAHAHPSFHPGSKGVSLPLLIGGAAINYAVERATLYTSAASATFNPPLAAERFGLMEMLRRGK